MIGETQKQIRARKLAALDGQPEQQAALQARYDEYDAGRVAHGERKAEKHDQRKQTRRNLTIGAALGLWGASRK